MGFSSYLKSMIFGSTDTVESREDENSFLMQGNLKNDKEIVTLFAIGIAAANADSIIAPEEKAYILNMAKGLRPMHPKVAQCIHKMLNNTSPKLENVLLDAYEFMTHKEESDWADFKKKLCTLIEDVVKADGIISQPEKEFIAEFEAYFLVKINTDLGNN